MPDKSILFHDPGPSLLQKLRMWMLCRSLLRPAPLRSKHKDLGDVADLISWRKTVFTDSSRPLWDRESVWKAMIQEIREKSLKAYEFGVASGYATKWWTRNLDLNNVTFEWHGFDRFSGLPRAWRGLEPGHFDIGGGPPDISHPSVHWHVGDVEKTLGKDLLKREISDQFLFFFDLDLFEPSLACWQKISDIVHVGDLIYFDEIFDKDERHLVEFHVLPFFDLKPIASSPFSIAFKVESKK